MSQNAESKTKETKEEHTARIAKMTTEEKKAEISKEVPALAPYMNDAHVLMAFSEAMDLGIAPGTINTAIKAIHDSTAYATTIEQLRGHVVAVTLFASNARLSEKKGEITEVARAVAKEYFGTEAGRVAGDVPTGTVKQ